MKHLNFNTREEVMEFLKDYGFKYYIPRLEEKMDACRVCDKNYYVEVTENNNIYFCAIVTTQQGGYSFGKSIFYDCDRAYDFDSEEIGEEKYKEYKEYKEMEKEWN